MTSQTMAHFMQKAGTYGLHEFLEIMGELSQESTKKGLLSRREKELITLGIALYKNCQRCIDIHTSEARRLEATDKQFSSVKKVIFFMNATPHGNSDLWGEWVDNWQHFSYSRIKRRRKLREMVALAISIVMQHKEQIELHLKAALDVGLTIEEVFEIVPLVMLMDGAPTLSQIPRIIECYEAYSRSENQEN